MKFPLIFVLMVALALPVLADNPPSPEAKTGTQVQGSPPPRPAKGKPGLQATNAIKPGGTTVSSVGRSSSPSAQTSSDGQTANAAPAAPPSSPSLTLDAYLQALTDTIPLSKDEQTDVKTYYLEDGAKLKNILNDTSISPLEQMEKADELRDHRNAKIEALLTDVDRQEAFRKMESDYRVALTELAAQGSLVPNQPLPNVPQPTAAPPSETTPAPNPQSAP